MIVAGGNREVVLFRSGRRSSCRFPESAALFREEDFEFEIRLDVSGLPRTVVQFAENDR